MANIGYLHVQRIVFAYEVVEGDSDGDGVELGSLFANDGTIAFAHAEDASVPMDVAASLSVTPVGASHGVDGTTDYECAVLYCAYSNVNEDAQGVIGYFISGEGKPNRLHFSYGAEEYIIANLIYGPNGVLGAARPRFSRTRPYLQQHAGAQ